VIIEEWQENFYNKYKERENFFNFILYLIDEQGNEKYPKIELYEPHIIKGKPFSIIFVVYDQDLKDYVQFKQDFSYCLTHDRGRYSVPSIFSVNKDEREIGRNKLIELEEREEQERLQQAEDEEVEQITNQYAYMYDYEHNKTTIDFNPRKCLFRVKGVCFGHPFYTHGISYMDCKAIQNEYGIKVCKESDDMFASTAYVCGGTKYMPTLDELVLLAQDMYNSNVFNNLKDETCHGWYDHMECNFNAAIRNNNKDYLDYFRNIGIQNNNFENIEDEKRWQNKGFYIFSNNEINDSEWSYGRLYTSNSSSLTKINRTNAGTGANIVSSPYPALTSICVERDKNYVVPKTEKYPMKPKPYEKDAENELF
jgi:hypothetical protein